MKPIQPEIERVARDAIRLTMENRRKGKVYDSGEARHEDDETMMYAEFAQNGISPPRRKREWNP